jgi:hypothetical protein
VATSPREPVVRLPLNQRVERAAQRVLACPSITASNDHDVLGYRARVAAKVAPATVPALLKRLWALRYVADDGRPGFGLGHSWDAFGDGSTDPRKTIYTYTTATAALAFIEGHAATGRRSMLERAVELVETILARCWSEASAPSGTRTIRPTSAGRNLSC